MLLVGAEPGLGVNEDTSLIKDAMYNFKHLYDKQSLTVQIPGILQNLQGSDTNIEIITSTMLKPLQMSIKGNTIIDISAHIFVQTDLSHEHLPEIVYKDADQRADEAMMLLRDDLKIDPENIKLLRNKSKKEILEHFEDIQSQSD